MGPKAWTTGKTRSLKMMWIIFLIQKPQIICQKEYEDFERRVVKATSVKLQSGSDVFDVWENFEMISIRLMSLVG